MSRRYSWNCTALTPLLTRFCVMRPASLNSRRTSALPTSRKESVLSSHMSVSWLNERNAHQETACYRAQREALSSKYAGRSTKG